MCLFVWGGGGWGGVEHKDQFGKQESISTIMHYCVIGHKYESYNKVTSFWRIAI